MKKILLPTDFSENAWNAAYYAITLYKNEECIFYLLNTYTPVIVHSRFMAATKPKGELENTVRSNSEKGLEKLLKKIKTTFNYPGHTFKTISSFYLLTDKIKDIVEEENINLIVTGTKGASGVNEIFMGSNTVRIIKAITGCPILAIPEKFEFFAPTEIALTTDFNRFYAKSELEPLIEMAITFNAVIRVVHVKNDADELTEIQQFNLEMLKKYLGSVEHYLHKVSKLNSISKTLEVFGNELNIHLLAMLNFQHSFIEKITREPVVKRLAFHTQIPLLVIPEIGLDFHRKPKKNPDNALFDYN